MTIAIVAAGVAVLVVGALLYPTIAPVVRLRKREWRAHRGHVLHWYANFDEDLQYEPYYESDIVPLSLSEVLRRGYKPTKLVMIVPRTFRGRVAGDRQLTLWTSPATDSAPMWLCTPPRAVFSVAYATDSGSELAARPPLPAVDSRPARLQDMAPEGPDVPPAEPLNWTAASIVSPNSEASEESSDDWSLAPEADASADELSGTVGSDAEGEIATVADPATDATADEGGQSPRNRQKRRRGRRS